MAQYRIDAAPVRDAETGEVIPELVGHAVQIVFRDTDQPAPIYDYGTGDPLPESRLGVNATFSLPRFLVETDDPSGLYLDWLASDGTTRGPVEFDAVLRDEALRAREAAEAAGSAADQAAAAAQTAAADAAAAAELIDAPADVAIATAVETVGSQTYAALNPMRTTNGNRPVGKGELVVNVEDYGAVGDAVADDTAAIQAAIDAASAVVLFPAGTYRTTATLTLRSGLRLEGHGATLDISDVPQGGVVSTNAIGLYAAGTYAEPVALTADAAQGSTTLTVTSTAGITAGDRIKVSSSAVFGSTSQPRGEITTVRTVDSATALTLDVPLRDTYAAGSGGQVEVMYPVSNLAVRGLTIRGPQADTEKNTVGIRIDRGADIVIEDVSSRWCHLGAVYLSDVAGFAVRGGHFQDGLKAGFGYGVVAAFATQDGTMTGVRGSRVRHLFTAGGGTAGRGVVRAIAVSGCTAVRCLEAGFDTHPGAEDITFTGCVVEGVRSLVGPTMDGFVSQGGKVAFVGCIARDVGRYGFLIQNETIRGFDVLITGCTVERSVSHGVVVITNPAAEYRQFTAINLTGVTIADPGQRGVSVDNGDITFKVRAVNFTGVQVRRAGQRALYLRGMSNARIGITVDGAGAADEAVLFDTCPDCSLDSPSILTSTTQRALRLVNSPKCAISGGRVANDGSGIGIMTDAGSAGSAITGTIVTAATRLSVDAGTHQSNVQ